jgi:hypothetical protein
MARPWIDHHWARRSGIYCVLLLTSSRPPSLSVPPCPTFILPLPPLQSWLPGSSRALHSPPTSTSALPASNGNRRWTPTTRSPGSVLNTLLVFRSSHSPSSRFYPPAPRDMALMIACAWSMGCSAGRGYRTTEHSLAAAELFETPRAPTPSVLPLLTLFPPLTAEESMSMFAEVCHPSLTPC